MPVSNAEVKAFFCGLYGLFVSGHSIVQSLNLLAEHQANLELKQAIQHISTDVHAGHTLPVAFAKYPDLFNQDCIDKLIATENFVIGEVSEAPMLDEVLEQLCCGGSSS